MINTVLIKQEQLARSFLTHGSGPEVVFIMGSCRVANIVNYFVEWNRANGNRFTVHSLDPFNWNWNAANERVDYEQAILGCEDDHKLLKMLSSVDIFIHEYYGNAGMFNVNKDDNKNIYHFGMAPQTDVCIPNWNDYFVLFADIVSFDIEIRKRAIQDYNVLGKLSKELQEEIYSISLVNLTKFFSVCIKSDLPEMRNYFQNNILSKRLFWSYNHTSREFTTALFEMMNEKFLHLDLSKGYNRNHEDMFANNYTHLSEYDVAWYHFQWGEEIIPLERKLF